DRAEEVRPAQFGHLFLVPAGGDPHLYVFRWEIEIRSHHSDDFAIPAAERDCLSDDSRVSAKATLPETVAQDHDSLVPGLAFVCCATEHCVNAEHRKEIAGDIQSVDSFRFGAAGQLNAANSRLPFGRTHVSGDVFERLVLFLPVK